MHNWLTMMLAVPDMPIAIGELGIGGQEMERRVPPTRRSLVLPLQRLGRDLLTDRLCVGACAA